MEKFKAVEKEMKTKAFSKEGLQATAKLDPAERAKLEACQFLANMVEELERQIESLEAEEETLQATVKKGKKDTSKADRLSEIGRSTERHKYHQGKLELLLRSLENGNVETEQVQDLEESIKYYVEENGAVDFNEDDTIYDELNLEEDEGAFGLNNDNDRVSSQDTQSIQDDLPESADGRGSGGGGKPKSTSVSEPQGTGTRRPSNNMKSPLPALATLHTTPASHTNGISSSAMKPAPLPTRAPGETLKYASAAAAAAASDKGTVGIAPLPPPPSAVASTPSVPPGLSAFPSTQKSSTTTSPSAAPSIPASAGPAPTQKPTFAVAASTDASSSAQDQPKSPVSSQPPATVSHNIPRPVPTSTSTDAVTHSRTPSVSKTPTSAQTQPQDGVAIAPPEADTSSQPRKHSIAEHKDDQHQSQDQPEETESVYHLPPGLQDLLQSFEVTKSRIPAADSPSIQRLLAASHANRPDYLDAEKPRHYRPDTKYHSPSYYPQEPYPNSDDPNLYNKIDTDTLFYIFYYRQNTYQQYMAAKALKTQSWRFHKQYQTWFQRHEEPKTITEEFEQGTYRFFDYESTW